MEEKNFRIVKETSVNSTKSLLTIARGKTVSVPCQVFAPYSTVKSAVSRLNQRAGFTEFEASTPDNGATIIISRHARQAKDSEAMKTKANQYCAACPRAHNDLNGRYCEQLRRYVDYDKRPPCNQ